MDWERQRDALVATLRLEGIKSETVLAAIGRVPRHLFVPLNAREQAYIDHALPLDCGQTVSQPFVVARMTELLVSDHPCNKVLEIGTGSGYQAAVLAEIVAEVYTIERIKLLYDQANARFRELGYQTIHTRFADGHLGWEDAAPFDGILVTAAADTVPQVLRRQLADGASLVIPVSNNGFQEIQVITRRGNDFETKSYDPVVFVPLLPGTEA